MVPKTKGGNWREQRDRVGQDIEKFLVDNIRRGLGRTGGQSRGVACPPVLSDYYFCKALDFAILPWELENMEADKLEYWRWILAKETNARNELEYFEHMKQMRGKR